MDSETRILPEVGVAARGPLVTQPSIQQLMYAPSCTLPNLCVIGKPLQ